MSPGGSDQDGILGDELGLHLVQVHPEDVLNLVIAKSVESEFDIAREAVWQVVVAVDDHDDRAELGPPAVDDAEGGRHVGAVELAALAVQPPTDARVDLHIEAL